MAQLRSLATVSGFTAISRVLGFLRDVLVARFLGASMVTDAFFTAFRFPNMFRRIFGEGAFNAAFVPLFAKKLEASGEREAVHFGSHTFSMLAWVLTLGTVIAIPAMGLIMSVVAPGFKAKFDSGWMETGALVQAVEGKVIPVRGAKEIFFQYESRGGEAPPLAFGQAALLLEDGSRVPLRELRREVSLPYLELPEAGEVSGEGLAAAEGFGLVGESVVEFALPNEEDFRGLALSGKVAEGTGGEVRLRVYRNHPETFPLTVTLGRITFAYLLCMALVAHLSGVLNTVKIFGMPAAAPIILNVVFIVGLVAFVWGMGWPGGYVLAWSVFLAGFLQLGALWWSCRRHGYAIRLCRPRMTPEMKKLFLLMGPGVLSAGIQQINLLTGGIIASYQQNAVSYLYYSERVYQLPLGMVGIAFGVVLLPEIARKVRAREHEAARDSLNRGIEYSLLISVPATMALMIIAYPIISGIFEWGPKFTAIDSRYTAPALSAFALGLPGYVLVKVLQPGYYAREDTKTPMYIAGVTVLTNIIISLILFWLLRSKGLGHVGIALATSVAAWVNVVLLAVGLRRRGYLKMDKRLWDRLWRIGICSTMMGVVLMLLYQSLESFLVQGRWQCLVSLGLLIAVGLASYLGSALTLGATSLAEVRSGFRRK